MKEAIAKNWPTQLRTLETEEGTPEEFNLSWLDDRLRTIALRALPELDISFPRKELSPFSGIVQPTPMSVIQLRWRQNLNYAEQVKYKNEAEADEDYNKAIVAIFEAVAEKKLIQPTFIVDFPKVVSALKSFARQSCHRRTLRAFYRGYGMRERLLRIE